MCQEVDGVMHAKKCGYQETSLVFILHKEVYNELYVTRILPALHGALIGRIHFT